MTYVRVNKRISFVNTPSNFASFEKKMGKMAVSMDSVLFDMGKFTVSRGAMVFLSQLSTRLYGVV